MSKEKDINPKNISASTKDIPKWNSFNEHMNDAWEEIYMLGELERKYPFFRINIPNIDYNINKNTFEMNIIYKLNLQAKLNNNYIHVNFGAGHNYLNVIHTKNIKTCNMEAQEQIRCDQTRGYKAVYEFFKTHGIVDVNNINFSIKLNKDILLFDDHDLKHQVFRGWTGGYDPSYSNSRELTNIPNIILKEEWDSKPYLESLEKRINSLNILFKGINSYAMFDLEENILPIKKIPNFKEKYEEIIQSEFYMHMQEFGKQLSEHFNLDLKYEQHISLSEEEIPYIGFYDKNKGIQFFIRDIGGYNDMKLTCELYVPKQILKKQDFDRSYIQYVESEEENNILKDTNRKIIGVYEHVSAKADVQKGFIKCLERLV
jgi:hypothetical protein